MKKFTLEDNSLYIHESEVYKFKECWYSGNFSLLKINGIYYAFDQKFTNKSDAIYKFTNLNNVFKDGDDIVNLNYMFNHNGIRKTEVSYNKYSDINQVKIRRKLTYKYYHVNTAYGNNETFNFSNFNKYLYISDFISKSGIFNYNCNFLDKYNTIIPNKKMYVYYDTFLKEVESVHFNENLKNKTIDIIFNIKQ